MSDKQQKPEKQKRGYKIGGVRLEHDIRVRVTAADAQRLAEYAAEHETTRAAAARELLHTALNPDEK